MNEKNKKRKEKKKKIEEPEEFIYEATETERIKKDKKTGKIISKRKYSPNVQKLRKFVKDTGKLGV